MAAAVFLLLVWAQILLRQIPRHTHISKTFALKDPGIVKILVINFSKIELISTIFADAESHTSLFRQPLIYSVNQYDRM